MQDYTDSMTYSVSSSRELSFSASAALRRRLALFCCLFLSVAAGVSGQGLLELGSLVDDPLGVAEGADLFAARVDLDLVRSAPDRLELPTPDGRVLVAELSMFEDRGDGDVMWAGGFPGWNFESVVLSITDGRLVGRFGEPGGAKYRITTGPTGSGMLVDTVQIRRDPETVQCPGGVVPEDRGPVPAVEAASADPPERVVEESNHNLLDILVVHTARAEEVWGFDNLQTPEDDSTTPQAASQAAVDYLNMVLRNGELDIQARLVHVAQAPASMEGEMTCSTLLNRVTRNAEVAALRAEHDADVVEIFAASEVTGCCGIAWLLTRDVSARSFSPAGYGVTKMQGCVGEETFAHEIGHNLGANHDPLNAGDNFEERREIAITRYAFGHTWFSPSSPNPPNIDTIMSYGDGRVEPWFSTVRVEPNRWVLGIAGERENERAMREIGLGVAVDYSDFLTGRPGEPPTDPPPPPPGATPVAPGSLTVMPTGSTSVKVAWVDLSDNENGFRVQSRLGDQGWKTARTVAADSEAADVDGLVAGGRYRFRVQAFNDNGASNSNVVTVVLKDIEYTDCVPEAPVVTFDHGYTVSMCIEYLDKGVGPIVTADALDYGLESKESAVLYFFDPDNAEVLIKVLDGCENYEHRWVFVAPVTTLAFNLYVDETATGERWMHRNPKGNQTATTKSDLMAFPCEGSVSTTSVAADGDGVHGVDLVDAGFTSTAGSPASLTPSESPLESPAVVAAPISGGEGTDCEPQPVPGLTLRGGYTVKMCVEYLKDGEPTVVGAQDYGLDSEQSAILYFFGRNNAEVLIKVLDGCKNNGHRWVFVAPVTSLAFNIAVESPDGAEVWTHNNRLNQTAKARSDNRAFACSM